MSRLIYVSALLAASLLGCASSRYAVQPVSRIAADNVGKPVSRLEGALGAPRKVDTTSTQRVYVWFLAAESRGAASGFHGCEMEVTVDPRSDRVLGYSLSNIGGVSCSEMERKVPLVAS
jgi:hypothetical protein